MMMVMSPHQQEKCIVYGKISEGLHYIGFCSILSYITEIFTDVATLELVLYRVPR